MTYTETTTETGITMRAVTDQKALAAAAARKIVDTISTIQKDGSGVGKDGMARIVLTGGGAGIETCRQLAELDHAAKVSAQGFPIESIDWSKVLVFFGDERFVPHNDPERNEHQAREALLNHVDIPAEHIIGYTAPAEGEETDGNALEAAAAEYEKKLQQHAAHGFDVHLLGMGPEGHVNSLFPHTDELLSATGNVVAVRNCPKPPPERVSLTISAINQAARVWLLVAGHAKREAAGEVARGGNGAQWPAALVSGTTETVLWVDAEATPE